MKDCQEFCDHLSDYMDGEIGETECTLLEEHLKECPECALNHRWLSTTLKMCSKGVSDDMPDEVRTRLKTFLRQHCKTEKLKPIEES